MGITSITGTITLTDGSTSEFSIAADLGWQQWGATPDRLGATVEALEVTTAALAEAGLLAEEGEEDDGAPVWRLEVATPATAAGYGDTWTEEELTRTEAVDAALEYITTRRSGISGTEETIARAELTESGATYLAGFHAAITDTRKEG